MACEYFLAIPLIAIIAFALQKEYKFFTSKEHAFGPGSFTEATKQTSLETISNFPSKLIFWRKSIIAAVIIACIIYALNKSGVAGTSFLYFFIVLLVVSAVLYYQNNFYNFHLYRHLADRIKDFIK